MGTVNRNSKENRLLQIVDILKKSNKMTTRELADTLHVSIMTIRRDLEILRKNHIVERKYGSATLESNLNEYKAGDEFYDLRRALITHVKEKERIASYAATLIEPNDFIFMDNGTTVARIIPFLPRNFPFTVLTYNSTIMFELLKYTNIKVIFPGGYYYPEDQMFISPQAVDFIRCHRASKAFISVSGIHPSLGITCINAHSVQPKQAIIDSSVQRIILTDATKFGVVKDNHFANFNDIHIIITDEGISEEWVSFLKKEKIKLVTV